MSVVQGLLAGTAQRTAADGGRQGGRRGTGSALSISGVLAVGVFLLIVALFAAFVYGFLGALLVVILMFLEAFNKE